MGLEKSHKSFLTLYKDKLYGYSHILKNLSSQKFCLQHKPIIYEYA